MLVLRQLEPDFESVRASTDAKRVVDDFEQYRPDVLVLAFDGLDKAQRYGAVLHQRNHIQHPHRTVILCNKDDARDVFELCKQQHFDDYVLYWPHAYDGSRLAMCIWNASRQMATLQARCEVPGPTALRAHARNLHDLEQVLDRNLDDGDQRMAVCARCLATGRAAVGEALEAFARRWVDGASTARWGTTIAACCSARSTSFKRVQLEQTRTPDHTSRAPSCWLARFRDEIGPAFAGTRALAEMAATIRPIVMVVDDDSFARTLVERMLDAAPTTCGSLPTAPKRWTSCAANRRRGADGCAAARRRRRGPDETDEALAASGQTSGDHHDRRCAPANAREQHGSRRRVLHRQAAFIGRSGCQAGTGLPCHAGTTDSAPCRDERIRTAAAPACALRPPLVR